MDISTSMSNIEQEKLKMQIDAFNKTLSQGKAVKQTLDKDDFLKILITQLTHQDPTKPMEDKEFVAQMAQFSTLEQMTNMSQDFSKLAHVFARSEALSFLGRTVEITDGDSVVRGVVEEVKGQEYPQVLVNGKYYDYSKVEAIR